MKEGPRLRSHCSLAAPGAEGRGGQRVQERAGRGGWEGEGGQKGGAMRKVGEGEGAKQGCEEMQALMCGDKKNKCAAPTHHPSHLRRSS